MRKDDQSFRNTDASVESFIDSATTEEKPFSKDFESDLTKAHVERKKKREEDEERERETQERAMTTPSHLFRELSGL